MKKENKQLAQQKRAEQRKKTATKNMIMKVTKIGLPVLAVILLVVLIIVDPLSSSNTNTGTDTSEGLSVEDNADSTSTDTSSDDTTTDETTYTPPELDANLTYYADIQIQDHGTITVKLDQASAPISSANFVALAQDGFYDGLTFHRIIEGFMMQGGDPEGNGTGGSENNIVGEFTDNGYENNLSHTRGAISMARSDSYNSASSQFFIVHEDSSASLDGKYAVFGYVTEGMDIVDTICESAEPTDGNGTIEASAQPVITSVSIRTE